MNARLENATKTLRIFDLPMRSISNSPSMQGDSELGNIMQSAVDVDVMIMTM